MSSGAEWVPDPEELARLRKGLAGLRPEQPAQPFIPTLSGPAPAPLKITLTPISAEEPEPPITRFTLHQAPLPGEELVYQGLALLVVRRTFVLDDPDVDIYLHVRTRIPPPPDSARC